MYAHPSNQYLEGATAAPPPDKILATKNDQLSNLVSCYGEVHKRMYQFRERLMGMSPKVVDKESLPPLSNGHIYQISDKIEALGKICAAMETEMADIERIG